MKVPKILVCPYCQNPFGRGRLVSRFTCPRCRRYISIKDIETFYVWESGITRKITTYEAKKVKKIIEKRFD